MASLPESFVDRLKDLATDAGLSVSAIAASGLRLNEWSTTSVPNVPYDAQSPEFWKFVYNRSELNAIYRSAILTGSARDSYRSADVQVAKMAVDYIAAAERAAQAANASRIRCTAWASVRHVGLSDMTYGPFGVFLYDLQQQLYKGVQVGNNPDDS